MTNKKLEISNEAVELMKKLIDEDTYFLAGNLISKGTENQLDFKILKS